MINRYLILLLVVFAGCGPNIKQRWEDYHDLMDKTDRLALSDDLHSENPKTSGAMEARIERLHQRSLNILEEIVAANPEELMRIRDEGESGIGEVGETFFHSIGTVGGKITVKAFHKDEVNYLKALERFK